MAKGEPGVPFSNAQRAAPPAPLQRGARNLEFAFVRLRCVASCTSRGPCKVEVALRRAPTFRATWPTSCTAFSFHLGRGRYRAASRSAAAAPKPLWLERRSGVSDHCRMQPLLAAASLRRPDLRQVHGVLDRFPSSIQILVLQSSATMSATLHLHICVACSDHFEKKHHKHV